MFQWIESDSTQTKRIISAAIVITLAAFFFCGDVWAAAGGRWQPLVDRLVKDGFDRTEVDALFDKGAPEFSPEYMARKMNSLLDIKLSTRQATSPPAKPEVMSRYLNPILIAGAYAFYREHEATFGQIEKRYGVKGDLLTAIMLVETRLGTNTGKYNAFEILASMALAGDFSLIEDRITRDELDEEIKSWLVKRTREKGDWAYRELVALIHYAQANHTDVHAIPSSYYGAIGQCQFMPSSAAAYGQDGSGDGLVDLSETDDALFSIANFLAQHGWKKGIGETKQRKVIYHYNHSQTYVLTILAVAEKIRKTQELFG